MRLYKPPYGRGERYGRSRSTSRRSRAAPPRYPVTVLDLRTDAGAEAHTYACEGDELAKFATERAAVLGTPIEFAMLKAGIGDLRPEDVGGVRDGEAVAVVCSFRLRYLSDQPGGGGAREPPGTSARGAPRVFPWAAERRWH